MEIALCSRRRYRTIVFSDKISNYVYNVMVFGKEVVRENKGYCTIVCDASKYLCILCLTMADPLYISQLVGHCNRNSISYPSPQLQPH